MCVCVCVCVCVCGGNAESKAINSFKANGHIPNCTGDHHCSCGPNGRPTSYTRHVTARSSPLRQLGAPLSDSASCSQTNGPLSMAMKIKETMNSKLSNEVKGRVGYV